MCTREGGPATTPSIGNSWMPEVDVFQMVMRNVLVLAPKNHAYVSKTVRDASLASMLGIPQDEDPEEKEKQRRKMKKLH